MSRASTPPHTLAAGSVLALLLLLLALGACGSGSSSGGGDGADTAGPDTDGNPGGAVVLQPIELPDTGGLIAPGPSDGYRGPASDGMPWSAEERVTPPDLAGSGVLRDPAPWTRLGPLSGRWEVSAQSVASDCEQAPLRGDTRWQVTQRGDVLSFEWHRGIGFARARPATEAAGPAIERIDHFGADGVTILDGALELAPDDSGRLAFDAELSYVFELDPRYLMPGETLYPVAVSSFYDVTPVETYDLYEGEEPRTCTGRLRLTGVQQGGPPNPHRRDLHFALRWPAGSDVDLDLLLETPNSGPYGRADSGLFDPSARPRHHADFARPSAFCIALASTGRRLADTSAAVDGAFVRSLDEAAAAGAGHHEEIIRCSGPRYGAYRVRVVSWAQGDGPSVPYELEAFLGETPWSGGPLNTSFGVLRDTVDPRSVDVQGFLYTRATRPPSSSTSAGAIIIAARPQQFLQRPRGFLTGTWLEFHRAAYEGLTYAEFEAAVREDEKVALEDEEAVD